MNKLKDWEFETIKLSFEDIILFSFIEKENQSSVSINAALLTSEKGVVTFDFCPLVFGRSDLKENEILISKLNVEK
ncbi:hypothetical protein OKW96_18605 [Sphingobacterium sp. KU25419]|nr:hypothetical protein OKW96_18605 [Sphingobacterium sp. KU25419]